jgi:uncharacterized protein
VIVGVISDTHGLLRPEALTALAGSDHILHAGDVGSPDIIPALQAIAPVTAIRGNIDIFPWAERLPETDVVELSGRHLYILHDVKALDLNPSKAGIDVVISGHSHRPTIHWNDGLLYFNPGSAGPKRFSLPISVGKIRISQAGLEPELITL